MFTSMHRSIVIAALVGSLLVGCSSAQKAPCDRAFTATSFKLVLSRGACMGACPVYETTIDGSGAVNVDGRMNTPINGLGRMQLDKATLCMFADEIDRIGLFEMKDSYLAPVADAPRTKMTVVMGDSTKTISWDISPPKDLAAFARTVDSLTLQSPSLTAVKSAP